MQTVDVVKNHSDRFKIKAMSAGFNIAKVEEILEMIDVEYICVVNKEDATYLQKKYPHKPGVNRGKYPGYRRNPGDLLVPRGHL